jgi:hypothetical protein
MKWYWAILLTVAIFGCMVAAVMVGELKHDLSGGEPVVQGILAISGIWAAARSSSVGWGLFVFLLWPIGFPYFLIVRYRKPPDVE